MKSRIKKRIITLVKSSNTYSFLIALISVVFLYYQISQVKRDTEADFAHRLKIDFYTVEERNLLFLIINDLLSFRVEKDSLNRVEIPYFSVDTTRLKLLRKTNALVIKDKFTYSEFEIEDYLLNHFEDLSLYNEKGLISKEYIYTGFGYYIVVIYENKAIKDYMKWIRKSQKDYDSYSGFEELYSVIKKMNEKGR